MNTIIQIVNFFNYGVVGIVIGAFIGLTTGYYFSTRKLISYQTVTIPLYFSDMSRAPLHGFYKGIPVSKLRRTYFYVWNSGNTAILSNDVPTLSPVRLVWQDNFDSAVAVPYVHLLKRTNASNNIKLKPYIYEITFEYLGVNDGLVLEVIHTKAVKFQLSGTIIGSKKAT